MTVVYKIGAARKPISVVEKSR